MRRTLAVIAFVGIALPTFALVRPDAIFTSNMVLQREKVVPVWGKADPGESVVVEFAGRKVLGRAGNDGRWEVLLQPLKMCAEGRALLIGPHRLQNVVVGDVWLISGQSNAEMSFAWGILDGKREMSVSARYPNVRAVKIDHKTTPFAGSEETPVLLGGWMVCNNETLGSVTAMGYFMAREINRRTGVPIGILNDNWSGCRIEPFICLEGMRQVPALSNEVVKVERVRREYADWCRKVAMATDETGCGRAGVMPADMMWTLQHNAMIEPLVRFPIRGCAWYQGCSNGGEGPEYVDKLRALVGGWRMKWGYDFPFYIVQLSSFTAKTDDPAGGNGYARTREAQRIAAETIPNCGVVVTIDIGNATDIHPKNKRDVGERLARWTLRDVYGQKNLVVSGPLFKEMKVVGNTAVISFTHVGGGLMAGEKGPDTPGIKPVPSADGKLRGFSVKGQDGIWHWADAKIVGETVVLSAKGVDSPTAARYAYRANPMGDCNLYNREGLPASPFATDCW
ncbi:MAG: hypothetical protein II863_18875 [Kiritimatiellae bacterium]|nr:hypothetical protein [Kiritimatiellia bacterium]